MSQEIKARFLARLPAKHVICKTGRTTAAKRISSWISAEYFHHYISNSLVRIPFVKRFETC